MDDLEIPTSLPQWMLDHVKLYLEDPEAAHDYEGLPTLLLIARGRKSGKRRPIPLIYVREGDAYVIVASNAGAPKHPEWYGNLLANPDCEIRVGSTRLGARARVAAEDERTKVWPKLTAIYPTYDDYVKTAAPRRIPLVVLDPTGPVTS